VVGYEHFTCHGRIGTGHDVQNAGWKSRLGCELAEDRAKAGGVRAA